MSCLASPAAIPASGRCLCGAVRFEADPPCATSRAATAASPGAAHGHICAMTSVTRAAFRSSPTTACARSRGPRVPPTPRKGYLRRDPISLSTTLRGATRSRSPRARSTSRPGWGHQADLRGRRKRLQKINTSSTPRGGERYQRLWRPGFATRRRQVTRSTGDFARHKPGVSDPIALEGISTGIEGKDRPPQQQGPVPGGTSTWLPRTRTLSVSDRRFSGADRIEQPRSAPSGQRRSLLQLQHGYDEPWHQSAAASSRSSCGR